MTENSTKCKGFFCRTWRLFKSPSSKYSLGLLVILGFLTGIIFWGGFHYAMEVTNTEAFCISCHEMEKFVFEEYKQTTHYSNRTGVRATCPDCHVPKEWPYKVLRKIKSVNEIKHKLLGSIDTPEKYEAKRLELAERVWSDMEATDSRECRNCHNYDFMNYDKQSEEALEIHMIGVESEMTCIECHQGIAHKLPAGYESDSSE
ncbi:MAG: NapC/NirT family cytochrome c [Gammaproteobacteria bacterium]|nr:NapC/NirT family cytochrome c [Gammaproteobacteria bacterium]